MDNRYSYDRVRQYYRHCVNTRTGESPVNKRLDGFAVDHAIVLYLQNRRAYTRIILYPLAWRLMIFIFFPRNKDAT